MANLSHAQLRVLEDMQTNAGRYRLFDNGNTGCYWRMWPVNCPSLPVLYKLGFVRLVGKVGQEVELTEAGREFLLKGRSDPLGRPNSGG